MINEKSWVKNWLQNMALSTFSLIFILLIGEWIFPKFLNKIPFWLYGGVDDNLRVLAQYSKKSVIPKDYIAILGDSNSVGVGDFYDNLTKDNGWYPDYAPAHFINKKLGIDVVSFGFAGAGSFDGIWSGPVKQFEYINSMGFDLKPPKTILIFFYEGNDLGNNLQYLNANYIGNETFSELITVLKLNEWLDLQAYNSIKENDVELERNLMLVRFLIKSVKNIFLENSIKTKMPITATPEEKLFSHVVINGKTYPLSDSPGSTLFPKNSITHIVKNGEAIPIPFSSRIQIPGKSLTEAIVNDKVVVLPGNLQTPPIFLGLRVADIKSGLFDKMLKGSYFIFENSVKRMKENFPNSDVNIIYLPSVASSYKIISHLTTVNSDMGIPSIVNSKILFQRHLEVCREMLNIAKKLNVSFYDTTPQLRGASSKGYIHGPKDWAHFNESGYKALSDSISEFLLHPNKPYQNCAT